LTLVKFLSTKTFTLIDAKTEKMDFAGNYVKKLGKISAGFFDDRLIWP
jgi:hypothetical protein